VASPTVLVTFSRKYFGGFFSPLVVSVHLFISFIPRLFNNQGKMFIIFAKRSKKDTLCPKSRVKRPTFIPGYGTDGPTFQPERPTSEKKMTNIARDCLTFSKKCPSFENFCPTWKKICPTWTEKSPSSQKKKNHHRTKNVQHRSRCPTSAAVCPVSMRIPAYCRVSALPAEPL